MCSTFKPISIIYLLVIICNYGQADKPFQYTSENEEFLHNLNKYDNFILFYAPWCKYCTEFQPTWNRLADMLNEKETSLVIAQVDCTSSVALCLDHGITGYPTLLYFKKGTNKGIEYKGMRDLQSLTIFITSFADKLEEQKANKNDVSIYQGLAHLTENIFEKYVSKGQHFIKFYVPWCMMSQTMAPVWTDLAKQYETNSTINIGKVDCTREESVCSTFGVKEYPHMAWILNGKLTGALVGKQSITELRQFINKMAVPENHEPDNFLKKKKYLAVAHISEDTFDLYLETEMVFINYYASWCAHCKLLAPTWLDLGKKFGDDEKVIIADVDCVQETSLCKQETIFEYPTMVLYKKNKVLGKYDGPRTLDSLIEFITFHSSIDVNLNLIKEEL